ncbi:MAG: hypothetical protein PHY47_25285 [Lachnospiraceae bacterium]|nr:hypothetical protein [Lachnospiraceae bacterium]
MDKLWWEKITNANVFINMVVDTVLSEKSIVLVLPDYVPWCQKLYDTIETKISKQNSKNSFDFINSPKENVGEFLLHKYCKEEKRVQYRPTKTYARFLAESDDIVLNDRYVWVQNIPENLFDGWVDFLSDYHKNMRKDVSPAVFILETNNETLMRKTKRGIKKIVYDKQMNFFDTYTFCALAVSGMSIKIHLKNYLAELVSNICGDDIELCAHCIKRGKQFLLNPLCVISDLKLKEFRSNGSNFEFVLDDEIIINKLIWKTQIKTIFPVIEDYRGEFIAKYRLDINKQLPIKNSNGEEFTEPEEVEIGTLHYMVVKDLFTVEEIQNNKLYQFKKARNTLAHLKVLNLEEVDRILGE